MNATDYLAARGTNLRAGVLGGLIGAVTIWIYEAVVWVGMEHQLPLLGILKNATGLVFGQRIQEMTGPWGYVIGTGIHFGFAIGWGILFAYVWTFFRARGYEATFVALFYAVFAWAVMHAAIALTSTFHPDYSDPTVIVGGIMSHFFFTVPLALVVKRRMVPFESRPLQSRTGPVTPQRL